MNLANLWGQKTQLTRTFLLNNDIQKINMNVMEPLSQYDNMSKPIINQLCEYAICISIYILSNQKLT